MRKRLDVLLVDKGLTSTRNKARNLIIEGLVLVDGQAITKPGARYTSEAEVLLKKTEDTYVSRGGIKLAGALAHFNLKPLAWKILDGGASTGGFTDCLLQNGAERIYAVDVGHSQLVSRLRQDKRVIVLEKTNLRYIPQEAIPEKLDLIVLDLSFISVTKILARLDSFLKPSGLLLILVKPQFEVGPENVGKKGLVRQNALFKLAIKNVWQCARKLAYGSLGVTPSPIEGADGNKEFFILLKKDANDQYTEEDLNKLLPG